MQQLSDKEIINKLKSTNYSENDHAMKAIYQLMYKKVVRHILKNSGSEQDADDIFQDGLIAFYKLAKDDRLEEVKDIQAYFFSICRNLWLKALKKQKRVSQLSEEHLLLSEQAVVVTNILSSEKSALFDKLLASLGESCHKVLVYYYYERLKMKEIMSLMNFSSEQVAKNKKSVCMKRLKNTIQSNPELKGLLI